MTEYPKDLPTRPTRDVRGTSNHRREAGVLPFPVRSRAIETLSPQEVRVYRIRFRAAIHSLPPIFPTLPHGLAVGEAPWLHRDSLSPLPGVIHPSPASLRSIIPLPRRVLSLGTHMRPVAGL
jgi:hypothetical protein